MLPEVGLLVAGRYRLVRELAQGGMGAVWQADDVTTERGVAIKFQAQNQAGVAAERRFQREAQALEQLRSPYVVQVLDHGVDASLTYIAMELLEGENLRQRIETRGPLPLSEATPLISDACRGLGAAHDAGLIHRDVKPSNLFVARQEAGEVVKLIDFGIARAPEPGNALDTTGSGLIGSPAYMSPEQARGQKLDLRSDLWSLGVVAFRLLSGREPFLGKDIPETLQRICSGRAPRITAIRPELPRALDDFFARAFAIAAADRFASAADFLEEFTRAAAAGTSAESEFGGRLDATRTISSDLLPEPAAGRRTKLLLIAAAALGVALIWLLTNTASGPARAATNSKPPAVASTAEIASTGQAAERSGPVPPLATASSSPAAQPVQHAPGTARKALALAPAASVPAEPEAQPVVPDLRRAISTRK